MAYDSDRLPQNTRCKKHYTVVVVSRAEFNNSALFFYLDGTTRFCIHLMVSSKNNKNVAPASAGK